MSSQFAASLAAIAWSAKIAYAVISACLFVVAAYFCGDREDRGVSREEG